MKSILSAVALSVLAGAAGAQAPAMRPLFNSKDLTGWSGAGYRVEDGAIVCTPEGRNLVTDETFANYLLDFEFQLTPGANNGLGLHYPGTGDAAYTGIESQILDNPAEKFKGLKDAQFHGSLYLLAAAKRENLKPAGEWNRQRVSVLGPQVVVELNGGVILEQNLDALSAAHPEHQGVKRRAGHLAWLGHGDKVAFRAIQIAEFPLPANVQGVTAAGFTQIFDGTSLAGWKHQPSTSNWTAANGILKHDGKPGEITDLWSEKEYGDLTMVFDWRWNRAAAKKMQPVILPDGTEKRGPNGEIERVEVVDLDSGIYLRGDSKNQVNLWTWPIGSGEVYGFRTDAKMPAAVRAGVTPRANADMPVGEWNRMMITLIGDRLTVVLNGVVVVENAQLPGIAKRGPIALQHHGAGIDFANLWIKQL
jgi:hypothetical protein